jgi:serine protease
MREILPVRSGIPQVLVSAVCMMAALWLASPPVAAAEFNPARPRPGAQQQGQVQQVIVKLRQTSRLGAQASTNGESAAVAADTARVSSLAVRARLTLNASRALGGDLHVLRVSPQAGTESAAQMIARLQADSEVEYAVPDRPVYAHATSNDPLATGQWYLAGAQVSATRAQGAWDITRGSRGVTVAVLDTGVLFEHPDLGRSNAGGKYLPGYDFIGNLTTANDGDGRDADASDPGDWVVTGDCTDTPSSNSSWHGTRVSGMIAAQTDNAAGVAGIMWSGSLLPVRVLGKCGGLLSDVMEGMRWAAGLHVAGVPDNPNPAQIINLSLGSEGACDSFTQDVVNQVTAAGSLVVVSAGNEGGPVDSPANCQGAMGVLGLRHAGTKVGFSSLGPQIGIAAPGGNCINTTAGSPCLFSLDTTVNSGTTSPGAHAYTTQLNYNVGTSFSAPIVSGVAGLMLAVNGNLKSAQLIRRMQAGAMPFPASSETGVTAVCHTPTGDTDIQNTECICTTSVCGAGMVNALGAVNEALRPIAAISAPATFAASSMVSLQAGGSAGACGKTIASYAWSVLSGTGALTSATAATTSILAPATGSTVVQLVVTDGDGRTDTATLTLNTTSSATTAPASAGVKACLTDDATITLAATDASAAEAGADAGVFTITRNGSAANALTVTIAVSGTAVSGTDYAALAGSVVIPAGQSSVTVTVTPLDDLAVESAETVVLALQSGVGYLIGTPASATVTIADNDVAASASQGGGGGGGGTLDVLLLLIAFSGVVRVALRDRRAAASGGN